MNAGDLTPAQLSATSAAWEQWQAHVDSLTAEQAVGGALRLLAGARTADLEYGDGGRMGLAVLPLLGALLLRVDHAGGVEHTRCTETGSAAHALLEAGQRIVEAGS